MTMLPDDASIEQVAKVFGVHDDLHELTPAAKKLNKGQMIAILGAHNELEAVRLVVEGRTPRPAAIVTDAKAAEVHVTVADIQSVQKVFGRNFSTTQRAAIKKAVSGAESHEMVAADWEVYVCCCPCCCATTVLEPAGQAVA